MAYTDYDVRYRASDRVKRSVWREKVTVAIAAGASAGSTDVTINGITKGITFVIPDLTSSHTAELILRNEDAVPIYKSGEKTENTNQIITTEIPVCETTTVRVETSGAETTGATFYIYISGI